MRDYICMNFILWRYVPLSERCNTIAFNLNLLKTATRAWEIKVCTSQRSTMKGGHGWAQLLLKVTQIDSTSDKRFLPPPGCLQWIYGSTLGIPFHAPIDDISLWSANVWPFQVRYRTSITRTPPLLTYQGDLIFLLTHSLWVDVWHVLQSR